MECNNCISSAAYHTSPEGCESWTPLTGLTGERALGIQSTRLEFYVQMAPSAEELAKEATTNCRMPAWLSTASVAGDSTQRPARVNFVLQWQQFTVEYIPPRFAACRRVVPCVIIITTINVVVVIVKRSRSLVLSAATDINGHKETPSLA